jgi:2-iminobutanoate/2-iminopropanoate deaminase
VIPQNRQAFDFREGGTLKDVISAPKSPKAIGPYSQAIKASGFLFVSGRLPIDPGSGQIVGSDAAVQAEMVLENLKGILESGRFFAGQGCEGYDLFEGHERFCEERDLRKVLFFGPARATVEVARLPKGALVEVDLIALA